MSVAVASPGMTLSAIPASSRVTETTSLELETADDRDARLELEAAARGPRTARSSALSASHGRAEWPLVPWKVSRATTLPRQPAWISQVGRLEDDRRASSRGRALEPAKSAGSGLCSAGSSSRPKRRSARSHGRRLRGRDRARARARPRDRPSCRSRRGRAPRRRSISPGKVALRGHRVVVRREHDERDVRPPRRRRRGTPRRPRTRRRNVGGTSAEQVLADRLLAAALRTGCRRARASARRGGRRARSPRGAYRGIIPR